MKLCRALIVGAVALVTGCAQQPQLMGNESRLPRNTNEVGRHHADIVRNRTPESNGDNDGIPVTITGIHHLGDQFSINEFWVGRHMGGNVEREGGGGSFICCAILPRKWRKGLAVEIRWGLSNWSNANPLEIENDNYSSIKREGEYKALVPVEYYDEPGDMFVHFFANNKVRVISTRYWPRSSRYPIPHGVYDSLEATEGVLINRIDVGVNASEK